MTARVGVGDRAPDFELSSQDGTLVRLKDFRGRAVVLYFYPKDYTPGCTVEAKTFRDSYGEFVDRGSVVIGVSSDSVESHRRFSEDCRLPFVLVSDEGGKVRRQYGVPSSLWVLPGRVTYVIDGEGTVRYVYASQLPKGHISEALDVIKEIEKESRLPDDKDAARGVAEHTA